MIAGRFRFEKSSNMYFSLSIMGMVFDENYYATENTLLRRVNFFSRTLRLNRCTQQARLSFFSPGRDQYVLEYILIHTQSLVSVYKTLFRSLNTVVSLDYYLKINSIEYKTRFT